MSKLNKKDGFEVGFVQSISVINTDLEIIEKDIDSFYSYHNKPSITVFLATIIKNYYPEAECSFNKTIKLVNGFNEIIDKELSQLTDKKKGELVNQFNKLLIENKIKSFKDLFKESEKAEERYRVSINTSLGNAINDMKQCSKYYNNDTKTYLRFLIHEYAALPSGKRERIIFKDYVDKINNAIENSNIIIIKSYDDDNEHTIIPLGITEDPKTQFNYLCGYEKNIGEETKSYKTFRIYRIKKCEQLDYTYHITKDEKKIKRELAYYGDKRKYKVKLTNKGYKEMYRGIVHLRPVCESIEEEGDYYILEFNASEREIYNYFFKFGAECQILEPKELYNRFHDEYKRALDAYTES